jgi:tetratricopeptide (TPR) repeat protein
MKSSILSRGLLPVLAGLVLACNPVSAREPVEEFLEGLRQRQYYDIAEEYLEQLRTNSNVSDDVRQRIPFEQGRILVDSSRTIRDLPLRMKTLDRAVARFQEFIKASPDHALAAGANTQLGNVLVERGRALLEQAHKPSKAAEKDALLKQSRAAFGEAQKVFDAAEKKFVSDLEKYPKFIDPKDEKQIAARAQALADLIQARLYLATLLYEHAQSYEAGTPEHKKLLEQSAAKYKELYEKYRTRLAGLYAGMWQGRNLMELGDYKRALGIFDELLAQPDQPEEFRVMKNKVLRLAMEGWNNATQHLYDQAAKKGDEWIKAARVTEDRTPEGLGIRYYTALALHNLVESTGKEAKAADENKRRVRELQSHALFVAKMPGEYQQLAKDLLSKYRDLGDAGPQNFAEARDAGKVALDAMQTADSKIRLAPVTKEQAKLPEFKKEREEARADAIKYYQLALKMVDEESSADDIAVIRYFLAYLNYDAGNIYDAAVLGEFLARKYPKSAGARPGSKIAMAAYLQSYNDSDPDDRAFEVERMVSIAEYITQTWPGEAEADEAWMLLGDVAIREQDLAKAAEYLDKVPDTSPRRGEADLKAGQALWGTYLTESRKPDTDPERPSQADLDKLAKQAQETLERGVARMRKALSDENPMSYTLLASELSLAQIYIGSGQADKAVKLLETPDNGVLAMVKSNAEILKDKPNFAVEAYKAALRAYVGVQNMEKAEATMTALDTHVAAIGGQKGAAELTRIYISLGRELEEQVQTLRSDPKRADDLKKVLSGFETFLTRISDRDSGNTFASLNWVGETFFRLGAGLESGGTVSQQAKDYYARALKTYETMLNKVKADPGFAPDNPNAVPAIEVRISMCQRRLGKHKEALDRLQLLLMQTPNLLEAQKEAAYTYQEWAEASKDAGYYINAMGGGRRDKRTGQYIIWGWAKTAVMVQRSPNLKADFHEARFNLAECRLKLALSKSGEEKRKLLDQAESDISIVYRLRPDMGGEEMERKYDRLLKTIQQAAGQTPKGLAELKAAEKAAAGSAAGKSPLTNTASGAK